MCGHNFIGKPFKPNFVTYLTYGSIAICILCQIYTIAYYDMSSKIFCIVQMLLAIQAIGKLNQLRRDDDLVWILNFIQKLYNENAKTESHARAEYFRKFALFTEYLFKYVTAMVYLSCITYFLTPIYVYVVDGKRIPLFPLYAPGIDESTTSGYAVLLAYHLVLLYVGCAGFLACEFLLDIVIISSLIFGKLIAMDTVQMNSDLENEMLIAATHRLKNVLLMHKEMAEYMERIDDITFEVVFINLSTASFGSIVCLYAILLMKFYLVAGVLYALLIQILMNCLLGNCVELCHDDIYEAAIQLKWYQLPMKEQHFYRFYIERCQEPTMLTVGGFAPLNMETLVQIYSKIYSFTMFIMMIIE